LLGQFLKEPKWVPPVTLQLRDDGFYAIQHSNELTIVFIAHFASDEERRG